MRKILLTSAASLLAMGIVHAASVPCNGFEIKIKNNTADDFLVNKIQLKGAEVQPNTIQKLSAHTEQAFTVNNSIEDGKLVGEFEFHTISLPSKKVNIQFDLKNKDLICHHDEVATSGDFSIDKTRLPGHVTYTINN